MLELAGEIARRKLELDRLRAEFDRLATDPNATEKPTFSSGSLANRILGLIETSSLSITAPEIASRMNGEVGIDTVRTTLSKLHAIGAIARLRQGEYCSLAVAPERGRRSEGG